MLDVHGRWFYFDRAFGGDRHHCVVDVYSKAKSQAKAAMCMSNLHQWSLIWQMYTEDNDGYFTRSVFWVDPLRGYYKDTLDIRLCPMAVKPESEGGIHPFAAWGVWNGESWGQTYVDDYGSYGMNGWVGCAILRRGIVPGVEGQPNGFGGLRM